MRMDERMDLRYNQEAKNVSVNEKTDILVPTKGADGYGSN